MSSGPRIIVQSQEDYEALLEKSNKRQWWWGIQKPRMWADRDGDYVPDMEDKVFMSLDIYKALRTEVRNWEEGDMVRLAVHEFGHFLKAWSNGRHSPWWRFDIMAFSGIFRHRKEPVKLWEAGVRWVRAEIGRLEVGG